MAKSAINYPAHDFHRDEQTAIAADPYDTPEKAKIFSTNFAAHGFLPVFFIVTNDGDQPISIANMEITLTRRITRNSLPSRPKICTGGFPIRNRTPGRARFRCRIRQRGESARKRRDEIETSQFAARAVEPHGTQSGFLFFDVGGITSPLPGAIIDISGVADAKGNELLFFEIPVDKYLNAPKNPN